MSDSEGQNLALNRGSVSEEVRRGTARLNEQWARQELSDMNRMLIKELGASRREEHHTYFHKEVEMDNLNIGGEHTTTDSPPKAPPKGPPPNVDYEEWLRDSPVEEGWIGDEPESTVVVDDPWQSVRATYEWFTELRLYDEQVFVLTLALFGGVPQKQLFEVYGHVHTFLNVPEEVQDYYAAPTRYFDTNVPHLMDVARATEVECQVMTNAGLVLTYGLDFKDIRASATLMKMLLAFYQGRLDGLINLLKQVAEKHSSAELRRRASETLGLLGRIEFLWIKNPVLDVWVRELKEGAEFIKFVTSIDMVLSGQLEKLAPHTTYAISNILATVYYPGGDFNSNVLNLVFHWSGLQNPLHQYLAAICCGRLGLLELARTIQILERLIKHDVIYLLEPLIGTMAYIFRGLTCEQDVLTLLETLSTWANSRDEQLSVGAVLIAFGWMDLTLKDEYRRTLAQIDKENQTHFWNLPIYYTGDDRSDFARRYRRAIREIFLAAVPLGPGVVRLMRELLLDFVHYAAQDPSALPLVRMLALDLCCYERLPREDFDTLSYRERQQEKKRAQLEQVNRDRVWEWLQMWHRAPKYRDLASLKEIVTYIRSVDCT